MPPKKNKNSKKNEKAKKFFEYDSSSSEYSIEVPAIIKNDYKKFTATKTNEKLEFDLNQSLHYIGSKIYHSQDTEYYRQKSIEIKSIKQSKTKALFKSIFREDNSTSTNFSVVKELSVSNMSDVILQQRLLDKSLKVELKNFVNPSAPIKATQIFTTSFKFKNFPTHVENHTLAESKAETKKGEFYRKPHIPLLKGYDSDNESAEPIRKHWENIDFKTMNNLLKQTLKTGEYTQDTKNYHEHIKEIISLLFIA